MYISNLNNIYNKRGSNDNWTNYGIIVNSCVKLPRRQKNVLKDQERNQAIF